MSAYEASYDVAINPESRLRKQVAVACVVAANDITNEDPNTANHDRRLQWANQVKTVGGAVSMANFVVWKVLENPSIRENPTTSSDGDVQYVVNSLIDVFAGT